MNLEEAQDRIAFLEKELQLRDQFVAVATHELRNPLTPIALEVDILLSLARRRANPSAAELASLERLQRSIKSFIKRATTFLDVTRIGAGKFTLECSEVDLSDAVGRVVDAHRALAARASCSIESALAPGLIGRWDAMALEEIAENLVSNAIRYGAGSPVKIETRAVDGGVTLRVSDQGAGIAIEHQARIFDLFDRATESGPRFAGFGVGLWISRQFARGMAGDISVESQIGQGASFLLRLPTSAAQGQKGGA